MQRNVWLVVWVDCLLSASVAIGKPTPPPTTWFLTTLYLIFLLKNGKVALIQCLKISNHVPLCWLIWALMTFLIQKTLQVWEILFELFLWFFFLSLSPLSLSLLNLCTRLSELLNWFNCLLFFVQVFISFTFLCGKFPYF